MFDTQQMPNVILNSPSLIQRHFNTPGEQQHSNSEDRHNNATKSKVTKRTTTPSLTKCTHCLPSFGEAVIRKILLLPYITFILNI